MYDFDGDMSVHQKQLDDAGVPVDISQYAGCTQREIQCIMYALLAEARRRKARTK